jgi:hypothetical protein
MTSSNQGVEVDRLRLQRGDGAYCVVDRAHTLKVLCCNGFHRKHINISCKEDNKDSAIPYSFMVENKKNDATPQSI